MLDWQGGMTREGQFSLSDIWIYQGSGSNWSKYSRTPSFHVANTVEVDLGPRPTRSRLGAGEVAGMAFGSTVLSAAALGDNLVWG